MQLQTEAVVEEACQRQNYIDIQPINRQELHTAVSQLKKSAAPGPDGIPLCLIITPGVFPYTRRTSTSPVQRLHFQGVFPNDLEMSSGVYFPET